METTHDATRAPSDRLTEAEALELAALEPDEWEPEAHENVGHSDADDFSVWLEQGCKRTFHPGLLEPDPWDRRVVDSPPWTRS